MQERGKLPQYGECWTSTVEHIHEGCRYLTEDVQSDIALRITNCFLAMSGHETYNCDLDKKPNLRGICISSMTDRAFNVYTEFYTHAQNICWFLRGQVWQEKISERTLKVGEQLKKSVVHQELLLQQQKESLVMQEQLLNYGRSLEKILNDSRIQAENVMQEIKVSSLKHQQLLGLMTDSLSGLQSWLIGEISWFDSLVFYISGTIIILIFTSTTRTASMRLPLLFTLSINICAERVISDWMSYKVDQTEIHLIQQEMFNYIWWSRQITIAICAIIIFFQIYFYKDYSAENNALLLKIQSQNTSIQEALQKIKTITVKPDKYNVVRESPYNRQSAETEIIKPIINTYFKQCSDTISEISKNSISNNSTSSSLVESPFNNKNMFLNCRNSISTSREALFNVKDKTPNRSEFIKSTESFSNLTSSSIHRYNLRNRQETPVDN